MPVIPLLPVRRTRFSEVIQGSTSHSDKEPYRSENREVYGKKKEGERGGERSDDKTQSS